MIELGAQRTWAFRFSRLSRAVRACSPNTSYSCLVGQDVSAVSSRDHRVAIRPVDRERVAERQRPDLRPDSRRDASLSRVAVQCGAGETEQCKRTTQIASDLVNHGNGFRSAFLSTPLGQNLLHPEISRVVEALLPLQA